MEKMIVLGMAAQRETVGFHEGGRPSENRVSEKPNLSDVGIDKNLAHRCVEMCC
jgi:hypothetical protein